MTSIHEVCTPRGCPSWRPGLLSTTAILVAACTTAACASALASDPLPILEGSWDMSTTVDGEVLIGLLTFAPDGLVIWDGDLGQRNVCEARPMAGGGGYSLTCPIRMSVMPNDAGELVATVYDTIRRETYVRRQCLRWESLADRRVCAEWDVLPREDVQRRPRRIILLPGEGATVRWPGGGGGPPTERPTP